MRSSRRQERRSETMGRWGSQSSLPPSIAAMLSSGLFTVEHTRNVLLDVLYSYGRLTPSQLEPLLGKKLLECREGFGGSKGVKALIYISILSREEERSITENTLVV